MLLLSMISCDTDTSSFPRLKISSDDFMPLSLGNSWTYKCNSEISVDTYTKTIIKDTVLDDKDYWVMEHVYQNSNNISYSYIRVDEAGRVILTYDGKELYVFDTNSKDGDKYTYGIYDFYVTYPVNITTELGTFNNCIDYFHDAPPIADEEGGHIIAEGVGIVRTYGVWGINYNLVSYTLK